MLCAVSQARRKSVIAASNVGACPLVSDQCTSGRRGMLVSARKSGATTGSFACAGRLWARPIPRRSSLYGKPLGLVAALRPRRYSIQTILDPKPATSRRNITGVSFLALERHPLTGASMTDLAATVAFGLLIGGQFLSAIYRRDQRFTRRTNSSVVAVQFEMR